MSSLRLDSLRLVWLQTFLQVTDSENLSAAARAMGVNQSTASRHIQALERWAGKKLIDLHTEPDGEEPGRMSRMTPDGADLFGIVQELLPRLDSFRTEEAKRKELLDDMKEMVAKMVADLERKSPSQAAEIAREQIEMQAGYLAFLEAGAPLTLIEDMHRLGRRFYADYEAAYQREVRRSTKRQRAKPLPRPIP